MDNTILEVRNISKKFPGVLALDNISLSFSKGKIHALLGKNGSGKTTLVNIISGVYPPTSGEIFLNGKKEIFTSPLDAQNKKIALVHQEMSLIPELSIAENIFLGRYPCKYGRIIDWKKCYTNTAQLLSKLNIKISPRSLVRDLSIGQQQMIEIVKAISTNPHLLILDEPTSALARNEVEELFKLMRTLRDNGETLIYITHRLDELAKIVDTVTVLRDSKYIGQRNFKDITGHQVVDMMFGETNKSIETSHQNNASAELALSVNNLSRAPYWSNINFKLYTGEVLGIAGMLGSGRSELLRSIYGLDRFTNGSVEVFGKKIKHISPEVMKKIGMSFASEDRKDEGLVQNMSVHNNLALAGIDIIFKNIVTRKQEKKYVDKVITDLNIKVADSNAEVSTLSGGNQQKVVIGNWLNCHPRIMIFDEPSKGIDIVAKHQIYNIIREQASKGIASIVVTTELEELIQVCDRILVLHNGQISKELNPKEITPNELYVACMGNN